MQVHPAPLTRLCLLAGDVHLAGFCSRKPPNAHSSDHYGQVKQCFNISAQQALKGKTDYVLVFENQEQIENIKPDLQQISKLGGRGIIITAKGNHADFVSRFFAPQSGINEDPVTGSAHTTLTPYWSKILNKTELTAVQLSERKGHLQYRMAGDRVEISGQAKLYMTGEIIID